MTKATTLFTSTALALAFATTGHAADVNLTVFDWAGFEEPSLIESFIAKHGNPTYSFFGDDDEAFQKVSSGFKADVGHPCSQMVQKYRDAGLIEPWDVSRIPEYANIAPRFTDSKIFSDDAGIWYIPTDYAYTAIAYNTDKVTPEEVASLQAFVDPKFAGKISLPDNTDDAIRHQPGRFQGNGAAHRVADENHVGKAEVFHDTPDIGAVGHQRPILAVHPRESRVARTIDGDNGVGV